MEQRNSLNSLQDNFDAMQNVFGNRACLLEQSEKERVWRIVDVNYTTLNQLRVWLESDLVSVAFNWIVSMVNTSGMPDELWAHRIGLLPISFNPYNLNDFDSDNPLDCTESTCIVFELRKQNNTSSSIDVISGDLVWYPLFGQMSMFREEDFPKITYPDILLGKLPPGSEINLRAYGVRGTPEQHAKWSSTFAFYRSQPTNRPSTSEVTVLNLPPQLIDTTKTTCVRCEDLTTNRPCWYFTIRLIGGLSFDDVEEQITREYKLEERQLPQYKFEQ